MSQFDFEIITGEAVALDVRAASFASRMVSGLIDVFALGIVTAAVTIAASYTAGELAPGLHASAVLISVISSVIAIPAAVETITRGKSLGKLVMGIQILREDGGPIRLRHAVVRALTGFLEIWMTMGAVAVVTSMFNSRGQRLGDMLAGTYAARSRGAAAAPPVVMPVELAQWVSKADIRRLPDGLALQARIFLSRAGTMHEASRIRMGLALAEAVSPFVAPAPPPGTHPERFVAAVLAERRNRELALQVRDRELAAKQNAEIQKLPHGVF